MKLNPIGPNQTEVEPRVGMRIFFSYRTPVAAWVDGAAYRTEYKWNKTTSKHINKWLDGVPAEEKPQAWFDSLAS